MAPLFLNDVVIFFSQEEWDLLNVAQKKVYRDVMMEILETVGFIGKSREIVNDGEALSPESTKLEFLRTVHPWHSMLAKMLKLCDREDQRNIVEADWRSVTLEELCEGSEENSPGKLCIRFPNYSCNHVDMNLLRTDIGESSHACKKCGKDFCTFSSFWIRLVDGHETTEYGNIYRNSSLDFHEAFNDLNKPYNCTGNEKRHARTHRDGKPYEYNQCG
ncbi:PREDICTED: zinc finger protein 556-like [Elephantulus edwardii]|uniref:zinc finger protein 556-like n=1 Tax=Elephantulus edwardii TaxID=28737 RepID=UPI0003F08CD3|nr:PREDICTED: zinc finger protein 556-like [Elephantulus edwardii]